MYNIKEVPIINEKIWNQLNFFTKGENWGNWRKMDVRLLYNLDRLREKVNMPIKVHCGFEEIGHAMRSYHKKGMAVDFHFIGAEELKKNEKLNLFNLLMNVWQGGVGVYTHWYPVFGFHLDLGEKREWISVKQGYYNYSIEMDNLLALI